MISVVICSINPELLSQVQQNISATIGVEYELLVWDNRVDKKGICGVYNQMAKQARYEYILFLHEDILFATNGWGREIRNIFEYHPEIGVIGLGGSKYKSKAFSGWYTALKNCDCLQIVHRFDHGDRPELLKPPTATNLEEVVCLDGVFICCRKSVWEKRPFNESLLPGFHFYDIDFSLGAATFCKVVVTFDIILVHITAHGGDFGDKWVETAIKFHKAYKKELPAVRSLKAPKYFERSITITWLDVLKNQRVSWRNKWRWIRLQGLHLKPGLYYSVMKFLFYRPLGLKRIHKRK